MRRNHEITFGGGETIMAAPKTVLGSTALMPSGFDRQPAPGAHGIGIECQCVLEKDR
jgi:hypothetical protein